MIRFLFVNLLLLFCVQAYAQNIKKIEVKGNKKVETAAIRSKLQLRESTKFNKKLLRKDMQSLFDLGYFYDIQVDSTKVAGGINLTYTVIEKPTIVELNFEGNSELDDDELLESTELKKYQILDVTRIRVATEKMEKLYEDKGYFLARIEHRVEALKDADKVKLIFKVTENDKVTVKQVKILGANKISAGQLKAAMITKEGGYFSGVSGSGAYKQDAFDRDVQVLNILYFNEGYVQAKVSRPQVYVTPDKKSIYITLRVDEGEKFNVGEMGFSGDLLFSEEELLEVIELEEGSVFSYGTLQKDLKSLQAKYGDLGYAFANPIPRTRIREKDRLVDISFEIDKGNKVYIGEINVKGNTKTRDKVLRREMRITEGELYNETSKRESLANIKRLGYFEEVNFVTSTPRNNHDTLNIDIQVKERSTGTIQLGAGYSSFQGFVLNGQVNQINLLGRGQRLGASLSWAKEEQLFNVNFTEPYYKDTKWEVGFDAYSRKRTLIDYKEKKIGGGVRFGHPLAPYLKAVVGYKMDNTDLELKTDVDTDLFPIETVNGLTSALTFSLIYDKRNDRFLPTDGIFSRASLEYAGIGGDLDYTKGLFSFRYYKNVFWDVVWRNNFNYGFIKSNTSSRDVPFNQLFLLGGANSLRGFEWFTIGRRKLSQTMKDRFAADPTINEEEATRLANRPFGGEQQLYFQSELQFPLIKEAGVLAVMFYDIGAAEDSFQDSDFRDNIGFGIRWFSPIGPLRFEWGFPLDRKEELKESSSEFQFSIGSPF